MVRLLMLVSDDFIRRRRFERNFFPFLQVVEILNQ